jgi:hypothetical protein
VKGALRPKMLVLAATIARAPGAWKVPTHVKRVECAQNATHLSSPTLTWPECGGSSQLNELRETSTEGLRSIKSRENDS